MPFMKECKKHSWTGRPQKRNKAVPNSGERFRASETAPRIFPEICAGLSVSEMIRNWKDPHKGHSR